MEKFSLTTKENEVQKEQNGSIILDRFNELVTTEITLRKARLQNEAPQTYEATQQSLAFWQDPENETFAEVEIPAQEVEVVMAAIQRRSQKRLSLITAKIARTMVQDYES